VREVEAGLRRDVEEELAPLLRPAVINGQQSGNDRERGGDSREREERVVPSARYAPTAAI
jgi:hypothetical protein